MTDVESRRVVVSRVLEKCFFVRASEVLARTTLAAKDGEGKIYWLELERSFHHTLVTTAYAVCKKNSVAALSCDIKVALFDFLLGVVNGCPQQAFFERKEPCKPRAEAFGKEEVTCCEERAQAGITVVDDGG